MPIFSVSYKHVSSDPQIAYPNGWGWTEEDERAAQLVMALPGGFCKSYCEGYQCKRVFQEGGCSQIHDPGRRKEALKKKKTERTKLKKKLQAEEKQTKLQQSRTGLQDKYGVTKASIKTSFNRTETPLKQLLSTPSPLTVPDYVVTPLCSVTTITYEDLCRPSAEFASRFARISSEPTHEPPQSREAIDSGPLMSKVAPLCTVTTITYEDLCRPRMTDEFPFKSYSPDHAANVSSTSESSYTASTVSRQDSPRSITIYCQSPPLHRIGIDHSTSPYSEPINRHVLNDRKQSISEVVPTYAQAAMINIKLPAKPVPIPQTDREQKPWNHDELARWACYNIRRDQLTDDVLPALIKGKIPTEKGYFAQKYPGIQRDATFHLFSFLPGEIKNKIWEMAVVHGVGRNCIIRMQRELSPSGKAINTKMKPVSSWNPLLHVCRDARSIAKLQNPLTFSTRHSGPTIRFSYAQDRLTLLTENARDFWSISSSLRKDERRRLLYLAIPLRDFIYDPDGFIKSMPKFPLLRRLWVLVSDSREDLAFSEDKRWASKIKRACEPFWKKIHPARAFPAVKLEVIDGLTARKMDIDGLGYRS